MEQIATEGPRRRRAPAQAVASRLPSHKITDTILSDWKNTSIVGGHVRRLAAPCEDPRSPGARHRPSIARGDGPGPGLLCPSPAIPSAALTIDSAAIRCLMKIYELQLQLRHSLLVLGLHLQLSDPCAVHIDLGRGVCFM